MPVAFRRMLPLVAAVCFVGGCVIMARPLRAPEGNDAAVMVLSNRLGGPLRKMARHAYIAVRDPRVPEWTVWECCPPGSHTTRDPFRPSFGDEVRLHGIVRGRRAERANKCLGQATERYGAPRYLMWPGPNSNTYVDAMLRRCGLHVDLPSTAVGKDHRGVIGVSWTSGGTGVQLETPLAGLRLGLKEGVEVHVLGLGLGVDLWPPAIIFPVGEGRLGFADR